MLPKLLTLQPILLIWSIQPLLSILILVLVLVRDLSQRLLLLPLDTNLSLIRIIKGICHNLPWQPLGVKVTEHITSNLSNSASWCTTKTFINIPTDQNRNNNNNNNNDNNNNDNNNNNNKLTRQKHKNNILEVSPRISQSVQLPCPILLLHTLMAPPLLSPGKQ
jgi:hypothetical protein